MSQYYLNTDYLNRYCAKIHAANVAVGWWSDKNTGESILHTRNRGEVMMLIVSELSEAAAGYADDLPDDKLPQFRMYDVELADTAIRLFDLIGAEGPAENEDYVGAVNSGIDRWVVQLRSETPTGQLMQIVNSVSMAMEHHRKGRKADYQRVLASTLAGVFVLAGMRNIDLPRVIDEKRAYNSVRPDHKLENRRKEGGKAY